MITMINGCNPMPMTLNAGTNTYLLGQASKKVLIDTTDDPKFLTLLEKELTVTNSSLEAILLTHYHWDHTGGVEYIRKNINPDVKVYQTCRKLSQSQLNPRIADYLNHMKRIVLYTL